MHSILSKAYSSPRNRSRRLEKRLSRMPGLCGPTRRGSCAAGQRRTGGRTVGRRATVSDTTEEQRMRQSGAPELPGSAPRGNLRNLEQKNSLKGAQAAFLVALLSFLAAWGARGRSRQVHRIYRWCMHPLCLVVRCQRRYSSGRIKGVTPPGVRRAGIVSRRGRLDGNGTVEVIGGQYTFTS